MGFLPVLPVFIFRLYRHGGYIDIRFIFFMKSLRRDYVNSFQSIFTLAGVCRSYKDCIENERGSLELRPFVEKNFESLGEFPTYNQRYFSPELGIRKNVIPYLDELTSIRKEFDKDICVLNGHVRSLKLKIKFDDICEDSWLVEKEVEKVIEKYWPCKRV